MPKSLPNFRADLQVFRGPDADDGSSSFSLYDPLRAAYYKISWAEATIIKKFRPGMTLKQLQEELARRSTLDITEKDILFFFAQAQNQGLLEIPKSSDQLVVEAEKQEVNFFKWLVLNYLFLKFPLINPDAFLSRTVHLVKPLLSPQAFKFYAFTSLFGFGLLLSRWNEFIYTFPYFFNLNGIVAYATAIVCTKIIHEFSHAYTAKKYGVHIPTMGIAFLVLWPVFYTDATDAWSLHSRRKRLTISAAGIIAELVLAGIATVGWSLTTPGILNSVFFVIASANWITTLLININPALRFDGYYILMDLLNVENLQSRAFNLTRRELYRILLGIHLPHPEPMMARKKQIYLIIYSIFTWIYRIFLYTAIALFVYFKFTKVLGLFLFSLEIFVFFIWPIQYEAQTCLRVRRLFSWNPRIRTTTIVISLLLIWFVLPWPHKISAPAITIPVESQPVYSLNDGIIKSVHIKKSEMVEKNQVLLEIESKRLESDIAALENEKKILQKKLDIIQESEELIHFYLETNAELTRTAAELDSLIEQRKQNIVKSTVDGKVYEWDELLREGLPVQKNQILGQIASLDRLDVICFMAENQVFFLEKGHTVAFRISSTRKKMTGNVERIATVRAETLSYPQLASLYGGDLPVIGEGDQPMTLLGSYYPVQIHMEKRNDLRIGETGQVLFRGPWRSKFLTLIRYVISIVVRESGF